MRRGATAPELDRFASPGAGMLVNAPEGFVAKPGDVVEIVGRTVLIRGLPVVDAREVKIVGSASLPPAVAATWEHMVSGRVMRLRIEVHGIVRSAQAA